MNKTAEKTEDRHTKSRRQPSPDEGSNGGCESGDWGRTDAFDDLDEHPSNLDLPTQKPKTTKLLADCQRLPKGSAERSRAFRKLLKVLHDEYAK